MEALSHTPGRKALANPTIHAEASIEGPWGALFRPRLRRKTTVKVLAASIPSNTAPTPPTHARNTPRGTASFTSPPPKPRPPTRYAAGQTSPTQPRVSKQLYKSATPAAGRVKESGSRREAASSIARTTVHTATTAHAAAAITAAAAVDVSAPVISPMPRTVGHALVE